jgi:hypothetical protein
VRRRSGDCSALAQCGNDLKTGAVRCDNDGELEMQSIPGREIRPAEFK